MEKNKDPEIAAKRIHISYLITNEKSYFKIKDEGKGFDWHYQMSREEDEPSSIPIPFPASWKPLKWFILPTSRLCAAKMSPVRPVLYCVWSLCGICRKKTGVSAYPKRYVHWRNGIPAERPTERHHFGCWKRQAFANS